MHKQSYPTSKECRAEQRQSSEGIENEAADHSVAQTLQNGAIACGHFTKIVLENLHCNESVKNKWRNWISNWKQSSNEN